VSSKSLWCFANSAAISTTNWRNSANCDFGTDTAPCSNYAVMVKGKGEVLPYSLPSVRPGADPGVQAVRPQVT